MELMGSAPVNVIVKDALAPVASGHDMIERAPIFDPNCSCHRGHYNRRIVVLSRFVD